MWGGCVWGCVCGAELCSGRIMLRGTVGMELAQCGQSLDSQKEKVKGGMGVTSPLPIPVALV